MKSSTVLQLYKRTGLAENLHFVDASRDFLKALEGIVEPEQKRRAIGDAFINVF